MTEPSESSAIRERAMGERATRAFAVFAFLWGAALFFHLGHYPDLSEVPFGRAAAISGLVVLLFPTSAVAFAVMLVALASCLYVKLPEGPNHLLLQVFFCASMLVCAIPPLLRGRGGAGFRGPWLREFAPILRIELLVFYAFRALHFLNEGFFDPEKSCAVRFYRVTADLLPFLPVEPWALALSPYVIYATETAVPLLLLFPFTRRAGIVFALGFHYVVAFTSYFGFTSILFALFLLFDIDRVTTTVGRLRGRLAEALPGASGARDRGFLAARGLLAVAGGVALWQGAWIHELRPSLWHVYGALLIALYLAARPWRRDEREEAERPAYLRPRTAVLVVLPLLVVFNGMNPYLGLKTETSFSMFTNLHTERGNSNHLFMPDSLQVFDFQRDTVRTLAGSDLFPAGRHMTWFELRTRVAEHVAEGEKDISLRFIHNGEIVEVENAEEHPELSEPYPYVLRKYLVFRPIRPRGICGH